jgi:hypothetical protein
MAHFAELDNDNNVLRVLVVNNDVIATKDGESEQIGIDFLKSIFGQETRWVQTSFNAKMRRKYANIGDQYRHDVDKFIDRKPFESWALDEETLEWKAPIEKPNDGKDTYIWDEKNNTWVDFQMEEALG